MSFRSRVTSKKSGFYKFMKRYLAKYNHSLETRPFFTQGASAAFLFFTGDYMCQCIEQGKLTLSIDYGRVARMMLYGSFVFAPAAHVWYKYLDKKVIITKNDKFKQITKKVVLDEFAFTPVILVAFFTCLTSMEHVTEKYFTRDVQPARIEHGEESLPMKITDKLRKDYFHTFLVDMTVWPPLQYLNFYLIPSVYRVLYINFCCIFWNAFLSMQQHKH